MNENRRDMRDAEVIQQRFGFIDDQEGNMTMLDLNLFSQMGLLVLGGPMLLMGLASFGVAGIAYGVRTLRHQQGWSEGPARPMVFLGMLLTLVGGVIAGPALLELTALL